MMSNLIHLSLKKSLQSIHKPSRHYSIYKQLDFQVTFIICLKFFNNLRIVLISYLYRNTNLQLFVIVLEFIKVVPYITEMHTPTICSF